jgi:hypothetical protein
MILIFDLFQGPFTPSLLSLVCLYGYSLAVYIPVSILWTIQVINYLTDHHFIFYPFLVFAFAMAARLHRRLPVRLSPSFHIDASLAIFQVFLHYHY